jgi:hypothetical protein
MSELNLRKDLFKPRDHFIPNLTIPSIRIAIKVKVKVVVVEMEVTRKTLVEVD